MYLVLKNHVFIIVVTLKRYSGKYCGVDLKFSSNVFRSLLKLMIFFVYLDFLYQKGTLCMLSGLYVRKSFSISEINCFSKIFNQIFFLCRSQHIHMYGCSNQDSTLKNIKVTGM